MADGRRYQTVGLLSGGDGGEEKGLDHVDQGIQHKDYHEQHAGALDGRQGQPGRERPQGQANHHAGQEGGHQGLHRIHPACHLRDGQAHGPGDHPSDRYGQGISQADHQAAPYNPKDTAGTSLIDDSSSHCFFLFSLTADS